MIEPETWREVDSNADLKLWEAKLPKGGVMRLATETRPPTWLLQHHYQRYGENPPEVQLGIKGQRIRMPGEKEWHMYGFQPRSDQ